jgi:large subunit ribosomal protein L5
MAKGTDKGENPMREIIVDKVTVNMGVGEPGEGLENAKKLMEALSGSKVVETKAHDRNPTFKLRKGLPIGAKTTLRGKSAEEFVEKALVANKKVMKASNFDARGNFSFGVREYIDFPGAKYDPKIGMVGFDVCVTLSRRGERVKRRKVKPSTVGKSHIITREEGIEFAKKRFDVKVE